LRIDLVGTTADYRRPGPPRPLPLNHLPGENRTTVCRIGEVGFSRAKVAASSVATAATSAKKPAVGPASPAMTSRPVFRTERRIVSVSSGTSVRGSTTSTDISSWASSLAAASAWRTHRLFDLADAE
jgi:hypothetical protein